MEELYQFANSGENIYVYAKNNSNVTISNATTINGAVVDPIKKICWNLFRWN